MGKAVNYLLLNYLITKVRHKLPTLPVVSSLCTAALAAKTVFDSGIYFFLPHEIPRVK